MKPGDVVVARGVRYEACKALKYLSCEGCCGSGDDGEAAMLLCNALPCVDATKEDWVFHIFKVVGAPDPVIQKPVYTPGRPHKVEAP